MNAPRLRVLSLGAGVQSTTLALMAAHGEIGPMPDCAIFADTGCGSRLRPLIDQIASAQRAKDDDGCRHREGQNEHDDDEPRAPIEIVFGPQDTCCSGDDHAQQDKRQGYAWWGEIVRHQAGFLAVPRPGSRASFAGQRGSDVRSVADCRSDRRPS